MAEVRLRKSLTVEQAEHAAEAMLVAAKRRERVDLDLTMLEGFQVGAAPRLANALRLTAEASRLTIALPVSKDDRARLCRFGLGPQLAAHPSTLSVSGRAQTRELRDELRTLPPLLPTTYVVHGLHLTPAFVSRRRAAVYELFRAWIAEFPPHRGRLPAGSEQASIADLVAEAAINVLDHSQKKPWDGGAAHSYLHMQWRSSTQLATVPLGFRGEDESTRYLTELRSVDVGLGALSGLLEIDVVDDGVGVAARHALSNEIFESAPSRSEAAAFADALTAGGTVKLRAKDCPVDMTPGYGSERLLQVIREMYGFVAIRSGRLSAFANGLGDTDGFGIDDAPRGRLAGTIVTVVLPVYEKPRPRSMPGDRLF